MEKIPENVIHVTGFGPFRGFTKTNPSWEAVKQLPDSIEYNGQEIPIVKHEVPVTYCAVDKKVDEIWETKPKVRLSTFGSNCNYFMSNFIHLVGCSLWCTWRRRPDSLRTKCVQWKILRSRFRW